MAKKIIKSSKFTSMISRKTKPKQSRYNKTVRVIGCQICGYEPTNEREMPLETHHISFQCTADDAGFHDYVHKNQPSNLVVLCRLCHQAVHRDKVSISGYQQHESGRKLTYAVAAV